MNKRINLVRKELKLSQEAFGYRLGITKAAISRIESGLNNASEQTILSICREFNVNEKWLRNGQGDMFMKLSRAELAARIVGSALSSEDEFIHNIFIALGQLSPEEWNAVKKFIAKLK